jgi:hypothetical protein
MSAIIRGWHRKTGCVTLVMAVVMSSMWLRTFLSDDYVAFWFSPHRTQLIYSSNETLCWCAWDAKYPIPQWYWGSRTDRRTSVDVDRPPSKFIRKAHYDSNDLRYPHVNYRRWWLSYRIAVPALTPVSAYLLMTKPPQHVIHDAASDRNRRSSTSTETGP